MGNLFSKKPKINDVDRAILTLKTQRRKLSQYQQQLERVIEREKEIARQLAKEKKRDRAILTLKKKKTQEDLLRNVDAWLLNVEQQLSDIELASKQKAVFESLKAGSKAINDMQREINIEDVQKLMDETAEAKAYQQEINAILGERLSAEDEDSVLAEFEELEMKMELEGLPKAPKPIPIPESTEVETEEDKQDVSSGKQSIAELAEAPNRASEENVVKNLDSGLKQIIDLPCAPNVTIHELKENKDPEIESHQELAEAPNRASEENVVENLDSGLKEILDLPCAPNVTIHELKENKDPEIESHQEMEIAALAETPNRASEENVVENLDSGLKEILDLPCAPNVTIHELKENKDPEIESHQEMEIA